MCPLSHLNQQVLIHVLCGNRIRVVISTRRGIGNHPFFLLARKEQTEHYSNTFHIVFQFRFCWLEDELSIQQPLPTSGERHVWALENWLGCNADVNPEHEHRLDVLLDCKNLILSK